MSNQVKLRRLTCITTEDWTGGDEIYLNYNGERIFGPTNINDGQGVYLGINRPISGSATIDLYDEDSPDPDDFLGRITISEGELNGGLRSQDFRGDGAYYTLFYRVAEPEVD